MGAGMNWRELADDIGYGSSEMLTQLAKGGRVEFGLMLAAVTKLGRSIASFTYGFAEDTVTRSSKKA
jgi:hypothetical protein